MRIQLTHRIREFDGRVMVDFCLDDERAQVRGRGGQSRESGAANDGESDDFSPHGPVLCQGQSNRHMSRPLFFFCLEFILECWGGDNIPTDLEGRHWAAEPEPRPLCVSSAPRS